MPPSLTSVCYIISVVRLQNFRLSRHWFVSLAFTIEQWSMQNILSSIGLVLGSSIRLGLCESTNLWVVFYHTEGTPLDPVVLYLLDCGLILLV